MVLLLGRDRALTRGPINFTRHACWTSLLRMAACRFHSALERLGLRCSLPANLCCVRLYLPVCPTAPVCLSTLSSALLLPYAPGSVFSGLWGSRPQKNSGHRRSIMCNCLNKFPSNSGHTVLTGCV